MGNDHHGDQRLCVHAWPCKLHIHNLRRWTTWGRLCGSWWTEDSHLQQDLRKLKSHAHLSGKVMQAIKMRVLGPDDADTSLSINIMTTIQWLKNISSMPMGIQNRPGCTLSVAPCVQPNLNGRRCIMHDCSNTAWPWVKQSKGSLSKAQCSTEHQRNFVDPNACGSPHKGVAHHCYSCDHDMHTTQSQPLIRLMRLTVSARLLNPGIQKITRVTEQQLLCDH